MDSEKKVLFRVRTKHAYDANQSDELSFKGGDVIDVYSKGDGDGWWQGSIVGKDDVGLFPSNYVRKIPSTQKRKLTLYVMHTLNLSTIMSTHIHTLHKVAKRPPPPKLPDRPSPEAPQKKNLEDRLDEILKRKTQSTYLDVKNELIAHCGNKEFEKFKTIVQTKLRDKSKAPTTHRKKTRNNSVFDWKPSEESRKSLKLSASQISEITSLAAKRASIRRDSLESAKTISSSKSNNRISNNRLSAVLSQSNSNRLSSESSPMIAPPPTPDTPPVMNIPQGVSPGMALTRRAFESTTPTSDRRKRFNEEKTSSPSLPPKRPREDRPKPKVGLKSSEWVNNVATRYSCTVASAFVAFGVNSSIVKTLQQKFGSRTTSGKQFPESQRVKIQALHARPKLPPASSLRDAIRRLPLTPSIKLCAFPDLNKDEIVELRPHIPNDNFSSSSSSTTHYRKRKKKTTPKASEFHTFVVSDPQNRRIRGGCLVMYNPISIVPCAEYVVGSKTLCQKFKTYIEKETRFGSLTPGVDIMSTHDFQIFCVLNDAINLNRTCSQRYTAAQAVSKALLSVPPTTHPGLSRKARPLTARISKEKLSRLQSFNRKGSQDDLFLTPATTTPLRTRNNKNKGRKDSSTRKDLEKKIQEMFGSGASRTTQGALRMLAADPNVSDEEITSHLREEMSSMTKLAIRCMRSPTCKESPLIELYESLRTKIQHTLKRCLSCHLIFQIPLALVLMGPFPRYSSMERVLSDISEYVRVRSNSSSSIGSVSKDLDQMLHRFLWQIPPPSRGLWRLHFRLRQGGQLISVARSPCNALPDGPEITCLVTLLFRKLKPRDLLLVYGALLMEERVIVVSKDMNVSAACAEAMHSLLYPLVIRVPFITTLPNQLRDHITSHKSCLIGVSNKTLGQCSDAEHAKISEICLVVYLDTGRLDLPRHLSRRLNVGHRNSGTLNMLKMKDISSSVDGARILPSKMYVSLSHSLCLTTQPPNHSYPPGTRLCTRH
jgi:hypothetical protein